MSRYNQLEVLIQHNKPKSIVEIGTWNGDRAIYMLSEALKFNKEVEYLGYDLFEDASPENDALEFNVKQKFSVQEVAKKLTEFAEKNPGARIRLVKGNTRETLRGQSLQADLAFVDGGHSIDTIRNDYEAVKNCKIVVLDDYYTTDGQNKMPDINKWGCNQLVDAMDNALVLPGNDPVKDGGLVNMVCLPATAWPGKVNLVIKTRNCVAEDKIQANIKYASTRLKKWLVQCRKHNGVAILVSGGPSFKEYLSEYRKYAKRKDHYIFCVKSSHDWLIENKIIPFGCFLLDPRPHVLDFIETPNQKVKYFCATMCHPVTVDRVVDSGAEVWGYNAVVGAGEAEIIAKEGKSNIMLSGGSTAATRGLTLLHSLGFRSFKLFGYDSCYLGKPDEVHGFNKRKKAFQVEMMGRKFWTDAELMAQAQDFDKMLKQPEALGLDLEVFGDGMIPHIWNTRTLLPEFKDIYV